MEKKRIFRMLAVLLLGIIMLQLGIKPAKAVTIKEDGKYALILRLKNSDADGTIDGEDHKIIRFDFDEGETTVSVNEITKGITAFNGKNKFTGWAASSDSISAAEQLSIDDFNAKGVIGEESYENGHTMYALFNGEAILPKEEYYIKLDGLGGTINDTGESYLLWTREADSFTPIDLSGYTAYREGYDFWGWGYVEYYNGAYKGKVIDVIDKSMFAKDDRVTIFALYKSKTFYGVDENGYLNNPNLPADQRPVSYVLKLDANGGTVDGKEVLSLDYFGVGDNAMPVFHYVPERAGCWEFKGWSNKKDGTGKYYDLIAWQNWRGDEGDFDREDPKDNGKVYNNLTLYAIWENVTPPAQPVNVIPATGAVIGSLEAQDSLWDNYSFLTTEFPVPAELAKNDVRYLISMDLMEDKAAVVDVQGLRMRIHFVLPDVLQGYDSYEMVTVSDNQIVEHIPATVIEQTLSFETTKLGLFGVVAKKNPPKAPEEKPGEDSGENPGKDPAASAKPAEPSVTPPTANPSDTENEEKITVKKSAIKTAKRSQNNKKLKLTLKKVRDIDGYQIKYSTSKKFTKKTTKTIKVKGTTKTIKKLKKKTYYVKVRAYKKVNGKPYYSKWSTVKKVKIRK